MYLHTKNKYIVHNSSIHVLCKQNSLKNIELMQNIPENVEPVTGVINRRNLQRLSRKRKVMFL